MSSMGPRGGPSVRSSVHSVGHSVRAAASTMLPSSGGPTTTLLLPSSAKGPGLNDSGLEKRPLSTTGDGPAWLNMWPGLCIEGVCKNPQCEAHGQRVKYSARYTRFDFFNDTRRCKCPACDHVFEPTAVGFSRCEWRISGTKQAHPGAAPESVDQQEWQLVGNCYARFKDDPTDQTVWTRLLIHTRKPTQQPAAPALAPSAPAAPAAPAPAPSSNSNMVECSICCSSAALSRFGANAINTPCGHCYHRACLQSWVLHCGNKAACPTCRRDISCLVQELAPR